MKKALKIDEADNIATTTSKTLEGDIVAVISSGGEVVQEVQVKEDIGFGHKIALQRMKKQEEIMKYGEVIGKASENILRGEWVHTHNVESGRLPTKGKEEGLV